MSARGALRHGPRRPARDADPAPLGDGEDRGVGRRARRPQKEPTGRAFETSSPVTEVAWLPADLEGRARRRGLDLSALLERAIERELRAAEPEAWLAENRDAIDGYNEPVAQRGVFGDDWRKR